jgi:hypothetical protein
MRPPAAARDAECLLAPQVLAFLAEVLERPYAARAMTGVELEPVDRVEITILMDNLTDPLLVDQESVARIN